MIEINLLPPEMRKVDRTSMKRLLCMITAVVLVSASAIGVITSVKRYHDENAKNLQLNQEVARLEPLAKEYDVLSTELQEIETRIRTIDEIRLTRLRWGVKLDQLYAILPDYVWFDKVELKTGKAIGRAVADATLSTLVLECFAAGADEKRYAEFRRVITGELVADGPYTGIEFFSDFDTLDSTGWSREDFPATEEGVALKFDLKLSVKPLVAVPVVTKPVRPVVAAQ